MYLNWLDIVLLGILAITVVIGAVKGMIRQVIGLLAVILGLILAIRYYAHGAKIFPFISDEVISHLMGFFLVFFGILCVGWAINRFLAKAVKGPFKSLNHLLGAGLGLIKGILICGIIVFGLLVFPVNTQALEDSQLAPYSMRITKAAYDIIPQDLKEKFSEAYQEIMGRKKKDAKRV
ncbi:MAG: CvpA family protein [Candidatus Aminicenantes bacterium]|nr:CvpA family protein [Candidatus Aminicenantes bacterium]MDH5385834.1 CvpA family protein [Candidatus Aminicenantes bacterium]MDH5742741.1 CvpA family protein [Candidatus Aminicenantes bacterium]